MSKYDFSVPTDRRGSFSYKWDVRENELPMWVADMDFETAPPVKEAMIRRASHGIFGYSVTPSEMFELASSFWGRRHGFAPPTEWMVYSSGVVAAISSAVRRFTNPAESVLIQAPVYNIFYNSILNNGRNVLSSDLKESLGEYSIDFADLEEKLSRPSTTMMILCNPHNPVGKIYTREELARIAELCARYGVRVFSDEIHADFTAPGKCYVPFCSVSDTAAEISVSAISPSKTFNLAGLQSAILIAKNEGLRYQIFRAVNNDEVGEPNAFAPAACIAAYGGECDLWVDELLEYVFENKRIACEYINMKIPALKARLSEATYLLWIDVSGVDADSVRFCERLRRETGLYLSDGAEYGECGSHFVRMNLATRRELVLDGLSRLERFVNGTK